MDQDVQTPEAELTPEQMPQEQAPEPSESKPRKPKAPAKGKPQEEDTPADGQGQAPESSESAPHNPKSPEEGKPQEEDTPADEQERSDAPDGVTALDEIAQQCLNENGMDVVFATIDGTLFGHYADARNHARYLRDETIRYYTRPGLPDEDLQRYVPASLRQEATK